MKYQQIIEQGIFKAAEDVDCITAFLGHAIFNTQDTDIIKL
jgi:hypothetical protein